MVRPRLLLLAVVFAGILAGCVGPRDTWVHASSRRFELLGATSEDNAEELVRTLEQFRTALLAIVFDGRLVQPGRIVVVVADQLSRYSKTVYLGGIAMNAAVPALGLSQVVLLDAELSPRTQFEIAAKHELTHAITLPYAPAMPHWYAEGLAGIFETIAIDHKRGLVTLDRWDRRHQRYAFRPMPIDQLFGWQAPVWSETSRMQYATAIQLLHMLQARYPQRLTAFETAIAPFSMPWRKAAARRPRPWPSPSRNSRRR
jgi:hypothetical protein